MTEARMNYAPHSNKDEIQIQYLQKDRDYSQRVIHSTDLPFIVRFGFLLVLMHVLSCLTIYLNLHHPPLRDVPCIPLVDSITTLIVMFFLCVGEIKDLGHFLFI